MTFPLILVLYQFHLKALPSLARHRLLNVLTVRLRRLFPRRLDSIFDLELVLADAGKRTVIAGSIIP